MAVDVCWETISGISPRYSFSHDLPEPEMIQPDSYNSSLLDPTFDFVFTVASATVSTADELFSDGKIIPRDLTEAPRPLPPDHGGSQKDTPLKKKSLREYLEDSIEEDHPRSKGLIGSLRISLQKIKAEDSKNNPSRSFWKFNRSSSMKNNDNGLMGSLKILRRSKSTGEYLEKKKIMREKEEKPLRNSSQFRRSSSMNCNYVGSNGYFVSLSRSKSTGSNLNNGRNLRMKREMNYEKQRSMRKGQMGSRGYVLNLPSPYISRVTVDLFGFGAFFCNAKERKKK